MGRIEQYPINSELVEQFCNRNSEFWIDNSKNNNKSGNNGKIYLNFSMVRMQTAWITSKLLYAKGVSDRTGREVIVFTWKDNPLITKYINSFGFKHLSLDSLSSKNPGACIKSIFKTIGTVFSGSLPSLSIGGVRVGNCFYEDILRTSNMSTIRSIWNKTCIRKIFHLSWIIYTLDAYFKKNIPYIAICDDVAYHEGAINKLYNKYGATIYASNYFTQRKITFDKDNEIIRRPAFNNERYKRYINQVDNDEAVNWSNQYLIERFQGKNGRNIDRGAFENKKVLSKEEILSSFNLDPDKKNIVIMAHTFTDAIYNYGYSMLFKDYYEWLLETLKIASSVDNVNWILKPHPTRSVYNESVDSIENMFERYCKDKSNMVILSDDISAETIKNIADVIVTIGGNAGAEFACFGVPAIIVGRPYYSGFGYTIEPASYEEYVKTLKGAASIERLSDEQIVTAKKVFYLNVNIDRYNDEVHNYKDELESILNGVYYKMQAEMPLSYFKSNEGTEKYNNESLEKLIEYMENNKLTECDYYKKGFESVSVNDI